MQRHVSRDREVQKSFVTGSREGRRSRPQAGLTGNHKAMGRWRAHRGGQHRKVIQAVGVGAEGRHAVLQLQQLRLHHRQLHQHGGRAWHRHVPLHHRRRVRRRRDLVVCLRCGAQLHTPASENMERRDRITPWVGSTLLLSGGRHPENDSCTAELKATVSKTKELKKHGAER